MTFYNNNNIKYRYNYIIIRGQAKNPILALEQETRVSWISVDPPDATASGGREREVTGDPLQRVTQQPTFPSIVCLLCVHGIHVVVSKECKK